MGEGGGIRNPVPVWQHTTLSGSREGVQGAVELPAMRPFKKFQKRAKKASGKFMKKEPGFFSKKKQKIAHNHDIVFSNFGDIRIIVCKI